jgi:peptidoglycan/LPS O-acetylase OafA/YrhL
VGRETKHFETLDALRGVAALAILIFHLGSNHVSGNFVPKAYLAVDFFFLLSGFVIARAYETSLVADRDIQLFLKRRAIRLYPLILLATILGFVAEASKAAFLHSADAMPLSALPAELVCGLLMIPYLGAGSGAIFPLVIPVWSLFLEIIANLLYALAARLLSMNRLVVFIICAALGFICVNQHYGNADEGFARSDVLAGMIRVLLSFFLGV